MHIDVTNPANSSLVVPNSMYPYNFDNPTASSYCNTIIAMGSDPNGPDILVSINLLDGAITTLCQVGETITHTATILEHIPPENCDNTLDLSLIHISEPTRPY